MRRGRVRKRPAGEQTVHYTGPPQLWGEVIRTGGKAFAEIKIKARGVE